MSKTIEVYRDATLRGPDDRREDLKAALLTAATSPWSFDVERTEEIRRNAVTTEDVMLFRRAATLGLPSAGLTLWANEDGYYVPNVVPTEVGELTHAQYNTILEEFMLQVAKPVAVSAGYTVEMTASDQSLEDWISEPAAAALRRFSGAANKSTGASHPSDQARWFAFIVAMHRGRDRLDAHQLYRWLWEVEGWDEESSFSLAGEYERLLALLVYADQH